MGITYVELVRDCHCVSCHKRDFLMKQRVDDRSEYVKFDYKNTKCKKYH